MDMKLPVHIWNSKYNVHVNMILKIADFIFQEPVLSLLVLLLVDFIAKI